MFMKLIYFADTTRRWSCLAKHLQQGYIVLKDVGLIITVPTDLIVGTPANSDDLNTVHWHGLLNSGVLRNF